MFRSLRSRLILSHILPAILIIPLTGVAIAYVVETQLILPRIYNNLAKEARLMAEITRNQPVFWQNDQIAKELVDGVAPYLSGQVSLVRLDGHMLASSASAENGSSPQIVELPNLSGVGHGEVIEVKRGALAEVFAPVFDLSGKQIGVVRMTTRVLTVSAEIYQVRYLLAVVLLFGVLGGIGLGSYLAFNINRPIQRVTRSIQAMAEENWQERVQEQGPDEMRVLAREVNTLVERLNNLEKSRRQLLANLVHELGTPLGAIRSAIHALLQGADKDPQLAHDLLSGLNLETMRLKRLIDDLAGMYDQVLGKLELTLRPVNVGEWLAGTISAWAAAARDKGVEWDAEIPADLPVVLMDPDRMAQALGNLLSNAVKFTPAGGRVSLGVKSDAGQLTVRVTDTGMGIPEEERDRVFQPFYRGRQGRRIVQGMGLGLSIARDIARAHGGDIELLPTAGWGTGFILRIPLDIAE